MSVPRKEEIKENKKQLRKEAAFLIIGLAVIVFALTISTFAWYIYNTQAHTTKVKMSAGSSTMLEIAKAYDGEYSTSVNLNSFHGTLNPVSTDIIQNGFQKVAGFTDGSETRSNLIANIFEPAESSDFFNTTLYLRTNAKKEGIYVSGLEFDESDQAIEMATAMRVGLVVHQPGENQPVASEYIFELSGEKNEYRRYNTEKGYEGCVLDSTKTDGSVVDFTNQLKTSANYAVYDSETGLVELKDKSLKLFELEGVANNKPGTPVEVEVYLWLEGCDPDCTGQLGKFSLKNFAIHFASLEITEDKAGK